MKESLSNCKYTKAKVRIDPMAREVTKIGQIVEIGNILWMIVQDRIIEATDLEEIPEGIVDRMIEEIIGMKDTITTIDRNRLRERYCTAETEVQAIVDWGQGLEPVQIGIG